MVAYPYLSPEWLDATAAIRERHASRDGDLPRVEVNYIITDVPFLNGGEARFHTDVRAPLFFALGHSDDAAVCVRTDYETARQIYRDSTWSLERLREGYASGQVHFEGDIDAIPEWWTVVVGDPDLVMMYDEIMAITA